MTLKKTIKRSLRSLILLCKEKELIPIPVPINTQHLLDNKVALITGGSSGIGLAIAEAFVKSGCQVVLVGRKEESLKACCIEINKTTNKENAKYIVWDILNVSLMPEKILEAAALFDKNKIDILVNSAGVASKSDFYHTTEAEYDFIMNTNIKGTFFMSQAVGHYMIRNKIKGHILNVSSSSALRPAWTPYQISKWGVRGFTLGLADTLLPHGIVVNAIAPGPTATPMLARNKDESLYLGQSPVGRYAYPMEIASLAVFMVSDMGNLIIGDTFYITGGSGTISSHN